MSYYANIYFKKVSSFEEGVKILNDYIEEFNNIENMKKVIDNNMEYLQQQFKTCGVNLDEICKKYLNQKYYIFNPIFYNIGTLILQSLLTFNAKYYPNFKLLTLCIEDSTNTIDKYFDGNIEFQNSCDQDYDYKTWNILGDYFINKAKEYEKMPIEKLINIFGYLDEEDREQRLDYFRKVAMYGFVYDALDLDKWMYGFKQKEEKFISLNFNSLPLKFNCVDSLLFYFIKKLCEEQL